MILITGGAGYIGSHVAKHLHSKGHDILILDDLSTGHRSFLQWGLFEEGSLEDTSFLYRLFKTHPIDTVIHLAGVIDIAESVKNPEKYFKINVNYTKNLLDIMTKFNVTKFIFSSTAAVYGPPQEIPITETHPLSPLSPYGESKLAVETLLNTYAPHGLTSIVFRYFNASGASPDGDIGEWHVPETHLIPLSLMAADQHKPFTRFGNNYDTPDGSCIRDFIHVTDIAIAHEKAIHYLDQHTQSLTLNLGTGIGISVNQIIQKIETLTHKSITIIDGPNRSGDSPKLVASYKEAQHWLHWTPTQSIDTILSSAWKWIKQNDL